MMIFTHAPGSPEYYAAVRLLTGEPSAPPRSEWQPDLHTLIEMHTELSVWHLQKAVELKQQDGEPNA